MKIRVRIITAAVTVLSAVFAFAASAFAAVPCAGPMYEPELPEKLLKD